MSLAWQELVGYLASALVVASLAMTSVVKLRMISLAGSITFVVYGLLIDSIPIVITNGAIAMLNVWFLHKEFRGDTDLGAVVVPTDSPFLLDFLHHHADDIRRFQPDAELDRDADFALVLTREGLPAGVLLGTRDGGDLHVHLDYVLKAHRDSRLGQWLYDDGEVFDKAEVERISSTGGSDTHRAYLRRVGFDPADHDRWVRTRP